MTVNIVLIKKKKIQISRFHFILDQFPLKLSVYGIISVWYQKMCDKIIQCAIKVSLEIIAYKTVAYITWFKIRMFT